MDWFTYIKEEQIIEWRHWLHQHPELAYQEYETSNYIEKVLQTLPNIEIMRPTETSIVATIKGDLPGKTVALRADIDALPIEEEADVPYRSKTKNVMHACGHDTHAAMLLGAAVVLTNITDQIEGTVKLIFQHAEELTPGGAKPILETGCLDDVDYFYGSHIFSATPTGTVQTIAGPTMASQDSFLLKIQGKGAHGSMPEKSVDPIMVGADIVLNLNQIVSRNIGPLENVVISMGRFNSGTIFNIIPDTAELEATIRTNTKETRRFVETRIREIIDGICKAHGATYTLEYTNGYGAVINDEKCTEVAKNVAISLFGEGTWEPGTRSMGSEDFSYYLDKAPGTYVFIGGGFPEREQNYVNHHPKFEINDKALVMGTKMYVGFALEMLKQGK